MAMTLERELLAFYLDDGGWHTEAENVRNGIDLESYENELRLIDWLRRHAHLSRPAQAVDAGESYVQAMVQVHEQKNRALGTAQEGWRVPDAIVELSECRKAGWYDSATAYRAGWNACRAEMLDFQIPSPPTDGEG